MRILGGVGAVLVMHFERRCCEMRMMWRMGERMSANGKTWRWWWGHLD